MSMQKQTNGKLKDINVILDLSKKIAADVAIIIVANAKANIAFEDYKAHSLATEFFAESEFEDILSGFRENGFYVELHQSEESFFKCFFSGGLKRLEKKYIAVYNAASGGKGPGRKALIPSFCNLNNIPITSSNPYVVSLCRHKYHFNAILAKHDLPVAKSWFFSKNNGWLFNDKPEPHKKVIAKPTYESASIGVDANSIFSYNDETDLILNQMSDTYDQPITVQEFISGYEVEVPVIINQGIPFTVEAIGLGLADKQLLNSDILTYEIVYNDNYNFYSFLQTGNPANKTILDMAQKAATVIGIEGFGRVDFRITPEGNCHIIDVSTYPHIIKHSSFWYMFKNLGYKYSDIFGVLVGLTAIKNNWK